MYFSIFPDACVEVGVPLSSWSTGVACCPNCRHELRVSLTPSAGKCTGPHTPPPFTFQPTYLPHTPFYATPSTPTIQAPYNEELKRLADTLRALRLSGWYYGSLDWQVCTLFKVTPRHLSVLIWTKNDISKAIKWKVPNIQLHGFTFILQIN